MSDFLKKHLTRLIPWLIGLVFTAAMYAIAQYYAEYRANLDSERERIIREQEAKIQELENEKVERNKKTLAVVAKIEEYYRMIAHNLFALSVQQTYRIDESIITNLDSAGEEINHLKEVVKDTLLSGLPEKNKLDETKNNKEKQARTDKGKICRKVFSLKRNATTITGIISKNVKMLNSEEKKKLFKNTINLINASIELLEQIEDEIGCEYRAGANSYKPESAAVAFILGLRGETLQIVQTIKTSGQTEKHGTTIESQFQKNNNYFGINEARTFSQNALDFIPVIAHALSSPKASNAIAISNNVSNEGIKTSIGDKLVAADSYELDNKHCQYVGLPDIPFERNIEKIREVVIGHSPAIQDCYTKLYNHNSNLQGKLVVRVTISPQGNVIAVIPVSSSINNDDFEKKVLDKISRWSDFGEVAKAYGNFTFRVPYIFGENDVAVNVKTKNAVVYVHSNMSKQTPSQ